MEVILDNYSAAIIFLVFCLGIIFEHRRGYRQGIVRGVIYGSSSTVRYLMDHGNLNATVIDHNTGTETPADHQSLTAYIMMKALEHNNEYNIVYDVTSHEK